MTRLRAKVVCKCMEQQQCPFQQKPKEEGGDVGTHWSVSRTCTSRVACPTQVTRIGESFPCCAIASSSTFESRTKGGYRMKALPIQAFANRCQGQRHTIGQTNYILQLRASG